MNKLRALLAGVLLATVSPASALPGIVVPATPPAVVVPVQANCNAVGQQIAAQHGGQLAKASPEQRGGQTVCVIVVLVPGQDGERPRREEVIVPQ